MIQFGDFQLHLIQESMTQMDCGGAFGLVPRALYSRLYPVNDETNKVPMPSNVLLLQTGTQNILIDSGNGSKIPEKLREHFQLEYPHGTLDDALSRLGLMPADIHLVINTHLHNDHCGDNTRVDERGQIVPTFANAEYVTQRREFEDASRPNERTRATYLADNFAALVASGQMRLLEGDADLATGVRGVVTPGHTPGHMSVMLESGGQQGLFVCDLASFALHFERLAWMTAYDVEPLVTLESKRKWQAWALETNALLFFPHDAVRPVGRYMQVEGGKAAVVGVEVEYS
ncbi:MAG: MBL fold metallo-hydrolase [Anaerolineae bacterium]|nr:MBL fold metallo-hydrolase [Anaerolineae bacterium]